MTNSSPDSRDRPLELFDSLPEAAFNAANKEHLPTCLENTRRNVLEQIQRWVDSERERRIYWLKGMAGIGKSTIALTVARKYARLRRLGASFFFSRGGGDLASAKRFATTIAAQLCETLPGLQTLVEHAIASNRQLRHLGLYEQWEKLILEPLGKLDRSENSPPVIIVVDALDECDDEDDVSLLIQCLAAATVVDNVRLRILVSSRPEQPINAGFDDISRDLHQDFILHDIEQSIVDHDLILFYKDRLARTAKKFGLGDYLLSEEKVQSLVRRSSGLFIHAATVCRFIDEGGQLASDRLSLVITTGSMPEKPEKELDKMYTTILVHSLPTKLGTEELLEVEKLFRVIVGSIVVLSEAMTPPDLATVIAKPTGVVHSTLHHLHSLLDVRGEAWPIRLLHPSFRDFLLDPARCQNKAFSIDAEAVHSHLFSCCIRVMKIHLRRNICNIERPGTRALDVTKDTVEKNIPLPLQYSCRYWIYHLRQSGTDPNDNMEIMDFFQTRFIYWLETLAWIGRLSEGVTMTRWLEAKLAVSSTALTPKGDKLMKRKSMLSRLEAKLRRKPIDTTSPSHRSTNRLYSTTYDAMRFIVSHSAIIEEAPLQVYCSALLFSPERSMIRTYHSNDVPKWILCRPYTFQYWSEHLQTLKGHSLPVEAVAFSPDGRLIASASSDETVRLWDATTGTMRHVLKGHSDIVLTVAFSPDSRLTASGSRDGTVRLWNTTTGAERRVLKGHSKPILAVAFSPDGRLIESASYDRTVRLWDATTGVEQRVLKGHSFSVEAVAFSPDGRLIVSASSDGIIRLWDATTGVERRVLKGDSDMVLTVAFSPDSRLTASGSRDGTVRLWDMTTDAEQRVLKGHSNWVHSIAFSPDGRLIASASSDWTVRLWDATTGVEQRVLKGHSFSVEAVAFSPDGRLIASASSDWTVRLWDTTISAERRVLNGHVDSVEDVAFSPHSRLTALGWFERIVRSRDATIGAEQRVLKGHSDSVNVVTFSPDSQLTASGSCDGTVRLWGATAGAEPRVLKGHSKQVNDIAFSPDGRLIASASVDETVRLWDTTIGAEGRVFNGHLDPVTAVAISPDGRLIASGSFDRTVRLWDATTGTMRHVLKGHSDMVLTVAFSPDGRLLASASYDGTVLLWDATTGAERHVLKDNSDSVNTVAFSPDSQLIASRSYDTAYLWDTTTGAERGVLEGHLTSVNAIAFSPDGRLTASASPDGTVLLWDATTGAEPRVLKGHLDSVDAIAFSPDGRLIASASSDETVRLWDATTCTEQHLYFIQTTLRYLSFFGTLLITDRGVLQLPQAILHPQHHIFASGSWVQQDGKNVIFLHPDYEHCLSFVPRARTFKAMVFENSSVLLLDDSSKSMIGG